MSELNTTLNEFLDQLKSYAALDFPTREVHSYLSGIRFAPRELQMYELFEANQYTRNLVYKSPEFEVLLICWSPGQGAPAHGHEGEKCWARVERGKLRFTNYFKEGDGRLRLLAEAVGEPYHLDGPADIHAVENPFEEPAVTLHLYSKPYGECDIYDLEQGTCTRKRLSYYSEFGRRL